MPARLTPATPQRPGRPHPSSSRDKQAKQLPASPQPGRLRRAEGMDPPESTPRGDGRWTPHFAFNTWRQRAWGGCGAPSTLSSYVRARGPPSSPPSALLSPSASALPTQLSSSSHARLSAARRARDARKRAPASDLQRAVQALRARQPGARRSVARAARRWKRALRCMLKRRLRRNLRGTRAGGLGQHWRPRWRAYERRAQRSRW